MFMTLRTGFKGEGGAGDAGKGREADGRAAARGRRDLVVAGVSVIPEAAAYRRDGSGDSRGNGSGNGGGGLPRER